MVVSLNVEANEDPNWHCVWVDKPEYDNQWGYHAGTDVWRYSNNKYNATIFGGLLGGALGVAVGKEKRAILGVLGATAGAAIGSTINRKEPKFEPYMKCIPRR